MTTLSAVSPLPAVPQVELVVDERAVRVPQGATLLEACRTAGVDVPTLCFAENLAPVSVCRLCVVELEGARTLVPSCSRRAEAGMRVHTDSERVRHARKVVLELVASSVDLSAAPQLARWMERYRADPSRFGPPASSATSGERARAVPGQHDAPAGDAAATVAQPAKIDNELYVRDYARCVLCYQCVRACGEGAQNTFAIAVAGRGFGARVSTEFALPLPASACVYCGNCIGVCPTGALMFRSESELRRLGRWDESRQREVRTVCPYCGVGCELTLTVQDERIVRVRSPSDSSVTSGHLCIKGRFGFEFVHGGRDERPA